MSKRKRQVLTIFEKKAIIQHYESGLSHQEISNLYHCGRSTVTKIINKRESIRNIQPYYNSRKKIVASPFSELETKVLDWCVDEKMKRELELKLEREKELETELKTELERGLFIKQEITRYDIMEKSKLIANDLKVENFKGNRVWFNQFIKRFQLKFQLKLLNQKETNGKKEGVDKLGDNKFIRKEKKKIKVLEAMGEIAMTNEMIVPNDNNMDDLSICSNDGLSNPSSNVFNTSLISIDTLGPSTNNPINLSNYSTNFFNTSYTLTNTSLNHTLINTNTYNDFFDLTPSFYF
ncbi:hypothetical protein K502DRAFT_368852 [Neoconidiobolus thromboides FSU 785]|nr:hypothetical protein K502DRAFT_368852 [Neoconidiobolus thromboides FSU 785]